MTFDHERIGGLAVLAFIVLVVLALIKYVFGS